MTLLSSLELNVMNYVKLFNYCNNEAFNHAITKLKDCSSTLKRNAQNLKNDHLALAQRKNF